MYSIFHSILANRHKFHFYIVHDLSILNRNLVVRTKPQSIRDYNGIWMIHKCRLVRNLNYKWLASSRCQPNACHTRTSQFRDRNDRGRSSQANIGKLVDLECHNLLPASQLYSNIGQRHSCHGRSTLNLDIRLWEIKNWISQSSKLIKMQKKTSETQYEPWSQNGPFQPLSQ